MTIKDSKYVKINSVNPLCLIFIKVNGYFEETNGDDFDEKYMKIKFNSDDKLPLNKTIEIPTMTIVVRAEGYP